MSNYVDVAVPEEHVMAVYRFLGTLHASPDGTADRTTPSDQPAEYTTHLIREAYEESSSQMRLALQAMVEAGDQGVTTVSLGEELGYEHGANAVAGMFGAFTRRCLNRYGINEAWWTKKWVSQADGSLVVLKPEFREALSDILDS